MNSRRSFIRQAGVLAGTSILATALHQKGIRCFRQKRWLPVIVFNVAVVGINGMGWADLFLP